MPRAFTSDVPERVVFGVGAEARTAEALVELGAEHVLLVAQGRHRAGADRIAAALGERCVGIFTDIEQHVPEALAEQARRVASEGAADWVVAHGGGTAVGFAKAIALTERVKVGAVVTTYAGSERTNIWGLRGEHGKVTGRDDRVRPQLVVYDPQLTVGLPRGLSLESLFNALAHSVEALYDPEASEDLLDLAEESVGALIAGVKAVAADPEDVEGRTEALYGAYLAATALDRAQLALHHKLAHVLGGTFGTAHATTHTVLLPYVMGFNGRAAPAAMARMADALGEDPPAALYDLARELGLPISLRALGITREDIEVAADVAMERQYANPRPFDREDIRGLLDDAWHERRPSLVGWRRDVGGSGPHAVLEATERGVRVEDARAVVIAVHGRGASADRIARDVEVRVDTRDGLCVLAPQALDNTWYPKGFTAPLKDNQPWLDSALSMLDAAWRVATAHVPAERVVVVGFSQGACLALSWLKARAVRPGAVVAMSGAELDVSGDYAHLHDVPVHLGKSEGDPWIPAERFERTAAALRAGGAELTVALEPGDVHAIHEAEAEALRRSVRAALTD